MKTSSEMICAHELLCAPSRIFCWEIINAVASVSKKSSEFLVSESRTRDIIMPRFVAYWLCRHFSGRSYTMIARQFGGRDHTTIIHGVAAVDSNFSKFEPLIVATCELLKVDVPARYEFGGG